MPTNHETELEREIARLKAENEALKSGQGELRLQVSEKGAISVYGLGRFPVSLYPEQWTRVLGISGNIEAFIKANAEKIKVQQAEAHALAEREKAFKKEQERQARIQAYASKLA